MARRGVRRLPWKSLHFSVDECFRQSVDAVRDAAAAVEKTIIDEATTRRGTPPMPAFELIFCVTCAAAEVTA